MTEERLYRITTPRFCGGVVAINFVVKEAAPCYGWAVGKHINYINWYCEKQDWQVENLEEKDKE